MLDLAKPGKQQFCSTNVKLQQAVINTQGTSNIEKGEKVHSGQNNQRPDDNRRQAFALVNIVNKQASERFSL